MKTALPLNTESIEASITDHPVDHIEPIEESEHALLAGAMRRLLVWQGLGGSAEKITARYMVLCTALGLDIGQHLVTEADIARAAGLSRAAVSLMANELRDQFGITTYNNRTQENRERCKQAHS